MNESGALQQSFTRPKAGTHSIAALPPGYFALVMATGIVSLAAHFHGREWIARGLFCLNIGVYIVLWSLTLLRLIRFRELFIEDLTHHSRGAGFLTMVAGTCVLGSQVAVLTPWIWVAEGLWILGGCLGLTLGYTFFIAITTSETKPSLDAGISGSWLLVTVATESVCILGALVAPFMAATHGILFISLITYLIGPMLYVVFITLILYRWIFFGMRPERLTPDYWINMGAPAITALAGALLLQTADRWSLLQTLLPFLTASTILFWATATWWIPLLAMLEVWRHLPGRVPLHYAPEYWAFVFPLGMYSVATFKLVKAVGLPFLGGIAEFFMYVALVAWAVTFSGMIHSLTRE